MGILDHIRTWHFETSMSPAACARTFADALGGRDEPMLGSSWRVAIAGDGPTRRAVATYTPGSALRPVPPTAAAGSQLTLTAAAGHDGTTCCTMAMARTTKSLLGFTAEARVFRTAMDRVARRLRDSQAGLDLVKR